MVLVRISLCQNTSLETLDALAAIFGCDISFLLGETPERVLAKSDVIQYTGLSERAIDVLHDKANFPGLPYLDGINTVFENNDSDLLTLFHEITALKAMKQEKELLSMKKKKTPEEELRFWDLKKGRIKKLQSKIRDDFSEIVDKGTDV